MVCGGETQKVGDFVGGLQKQRQNLKTKFTTKGKQLSLKHLVLDERKKHKGREKEAENEENLDCGWL